jgi:succinate dehydrogenase/fumarate reductase cytochrome b subunit (b558 family)
VATPSRARTLFTLSGVFPLGVFLLEHLAANSTAIAGEEAFAATVRAVKKLPVLFAIEVIFIFAPLAFHAAYGLLLILRKEKLERAYSPLFSRVLRITGVVALAYVVFHLVEIRFRAFGAGELLFVRVAQLLSASILGIPWRALLYVIGVGAVVLHFATGLWGWLVARGTLASERARKRGAWALVAAGAVLYFAGFNVIVYMATGSKIVGPATQAEPSKAVCPAPSASP